jgi:hypothetical protein
MLYYKSNGRKELKLDKGPAEPVVIADAVAPPAPAAPQEA